MPADFLLPAFALTLAVNAAFILVAIRSMRADRAEVAAHRRSGDPGSGAEPSVTVPAALPSTRDAGPEPSQPPGQSTGVSPAAAPGHTASPVASASDDATRIDSPPPPPVSEPEDPGHGEPTAAGRSTASPATRAPARTGRRRKFSLPPLEDAEKVSRQIETFLAGSDVAPPAANPAVDSGAPPTNGPVSPAPVVTVAAIQLLGSSSRGVLERTVRSTARGTDTVTVDRRGRVRVVLAGTGELAAHAYLRRIRAIVEPVLEADDPTSHVVIATATEIDGAVATARRRADRRLAVALRAAAADAGRSLDAADEIADLDAPEAPESRAAGD